MGEVSRWCYFLFLEGEGGGGYIIFYKLIEFQICIVIKKKNIRLYIYFFLDC